MKNLRLHWDAEAGWVVDVPVHLPQRQVYNLIQYALPRQIDRWRGLPPGERKGELGRAIELLRQGKVKQRLLEVDKVLRMLG